MNDRPIDGSLRLNRFLARAGLGSRRRVEDLVRAGQVTINGAVESSLGRRVDPERDRVEVAGRPVILPDRWRVLAFHKPVGVVSTLRAQMGQTGLAAFRRRQNLPRSVVPVGRLDRDTSGLLLWTDDGDLAQRLCRPASGVWKRYHVDLDRPLTAADRDALRAGGIVLDGRPCLPVRLRQRPPADGRRWALEMREGRKRQIRRLFAGFGLVVIGLARVAVGPVTLGRLPVGGFRDLTRQEENELRRAAGCE